MTTCTVGSVGGVFWESIFPSTAFSEHVAALYAVGQAGRPWAYVSVCVLSMRWLQWSLGPVRYTERLWGGYICTTGQTGAISYTMLVSLGVGSLVDLKGKSSFKHYLSIIYHQSVMFSAFRGLFTDERVVNKFFVKPHLLVLG